MSQGSPLFQQHRVKGADPGNNRKRALPQEVHAQEGKAAKKKASAPLRTNAAEFSEQGKKDRKDKNRNF